MRSARSLVGRAVEALPENLSLALRPSRYRYDPAARPKAIPIPQTPTRLLIGRANFAAQGFAFARAAERLDGVGAVCVHVHAANRRYGFPSDVGVPADVFQHSAHWRREAFRIVARSFTHVIIESGRSLFGKLFDNDLVREVEALRAAGVSVAFLAHGSELRLPSRHRDIDEWSPFRDSDWADIPTLESGAINFRRLASSSSVPMFVTTPDLLLDWPSATWLPVAVDQDLWRSNVAPLTRERPVVVHAPTSSRIKGTDLIEPVVRRLHNEGLIEYRRLEGIPSANMPAAIAEADIVLEQFRIGTYSVAAVEAMSSGRLVIAHIHAQVCKEVATRHNRELPVVSCAADNLESLLADVLDDRERYRAIAADGPSFVRAFHSGSASANALESFLQ